MHELQLDFVDTLAARQWVPNGTKNGEMFVVETVGGWSVAMFWDWQYVDLYTGEPLFGDVLQFAKLPDRAS